MDDFVQQLLRERGVPTDMDPEVHNELVEELTERANDFLNRSLIDAMNDDAVERFTALLESSSADEKAVQDFITTNVPNKEQVAVTALTEFRSLYLGDKA